MKVSTFHRPLSQPRLLVKPSHSRSASTSTSSSSSSPHPTSTFHSNSNTLLPPPQLVVTREQRRIGTHLLLATCALVLVSAGAATVILMWITVIRGIPAIPGQDVFVSALKHGAFLTSEDSKVGEGGTVDGKLVALTMTTITVSFSRRVLFGGTD